MSLAAGCDLLGPKVDHDNVGMAFELSKDSTDIDRGSYHGTRPQTDGDTIGTLRVVLPGYRLALNGGSITQGDHVVVQRATPTIHSGGSGNVCSDGH